MTFPNRFVNPYSFVPLAELASANCAQPTWHDARDPGLFSGTVELTWTLRSPLLLPANAKAEGWLRGDQLRIPGSSVAGAVRSLHEALFNGCLRVIDDTYLPGYREAATSNPDLKLAIVTKQQDGVPLELRLCDDPVWVDSGDLLSRWPRGEALPTTGDVLRFSGAIEELEGLARAEFVQVDRFDIVRRAGRATAPTASDAGARVLMVSSTSARKPRKGNREPARALWVADRITTALVAIDPTLDAAMLARFRAAADGTDDRRRLENDEPDGDWRRKTRFTPVEWWGPDGRRKVPVGRRALATGLLFEGDPVWVLRDNAGRVTDMKLAHIWRRAGSGPVSERLPDHLKPCVPGDGRPLCLSCATFGAADTTGQKHQQVSYAGHVRFGAARGTVKGPIQTVDLAPLGAPRAGNGMFYLSRYDAAAQGRAPAGGDPVATHWGSVQEGGKRRIAGRKFYWHTRPDAQAEALTKELGRPVPPRYTATDKQRSAKMSRPAQLVPAAELKSTVTVDQLDAAGVHALLAALDPARVLASVSGSRQRDFATHLGGGKPFGLGSVSATITSVDLKPLASRYGATDAAGPDWVGAPFPYTDLTSRVGDYTRNLTALAVMLDQSGLGGDAKLVSYPPGAEWPHYRSSQPTGTANETYGDRFAESFRFFGEANGEAQVRRTKPWAPLPRPGENPTLPIVLPPTRRP